jgi:hypothetical protein
MRQLAMAMLGLIPPLIHLVAVAHISNGQDGVPVSALGVYLRDRAELLGSGGRVLLCPGIVASMADTSTLRVELGIAVGLLADCSPARRSVVREAPGETLVLERAAVSGDTLLLVGHGTRRPIINSFPVEFVTWGERAALRRAGTSNSWYVESITLTGVARALSRRRPDASIDADSANLRDALMR